MTSQKGNDPEEFYKRTRERNVGMLARIYEILEGADDEDESFEDEFETAAPSEEVTVRIRNPLAQGGK